MLSILRQLSCAFAPVFLKDSNSSQWGFPVMWAPIARGKPGHHRMLMADSE